MIHKRRLDELLMLGGLIQEVHRVGHCAMDVIAITGEVAANDIAIGFQQELHAGPGQGNLDVTHWALNSQVVDRRQPDNQRACHGLIRNLRPWHPSRYFAMFDLVGFFPAMPA